MGLCRWGGHPGISGSALAVQDHLAGNAVYPVRQGVNINAVRKVMGLEADPVFALKKLQGVPKDQVAGKVIYPELKSPPDPGTYFNLCLI